MKLKRFTILLISLVFAVWQSFAQSVPSGYSVGTWSGFRTAAATFTFDDDAPSHITVVAPAFEERGYRATFNVVVNWMNQANQWSSFQKLANKGHEIASHTVTHSQNTPSDELSSSKTTINQKITGQDCNTIAYPYCNVPSDRNALSQNYIGGRICDGQVMGKTPSDYFQISAITTGSEANFTSTSNFTSSMQSAISKGGWVVFLTHGIQGESNGNATYSPTDISAITGALDWAKQNDSKIWVATFRDAILYAKERDALKLTETTESSKLKLTVSVNITSSIVEYDYPITVRREMPNGWSNISVSLNNEDIDVEMKTVNGKQYAEFDVIPGKTYYLENRAKKSWDIFLLFGQSNMAGQGTIEAIDRVTNDQVKVLAYNNCSSLGRTYNQWYTAAPPLHGCYEGVGIGDWFAKTLIDSGYTDTIALVPCAISGVDIDFFRKDVVSSRRNEFSIPPDNNWDGAYDFMIQRLTLAMEKGTIKGILLHQGESDSGNEQWLTKVQEIIADLKEDLGFGDVPVLVGEIPYKSVCSGHNTVVNKITNYVPNSKVISAEGLDGMNDDYHLDAASYRTFGKRYAAGYLSLVRGESGSSGDGTLTNLISNGEFDDGTSGWQTQTGGDAKCTMTATTSAGLSGANAVQFCPDGNYGTENWHIQMFQNVMLEPNVDYTLKFTAKGGSSRILYVMVQKIAADYDTYFYKEYNLTTSAQEFEEIITTPADVAADSKVTFCIGGADGCLYLDKVSFTYEETGGGGGGGGGDNPHYDVDITGDISKYFIDKAYVGPSCDALEGEEVTNGAYFTGVYPNLFVKYLGKTQAQVDQKMQSLWNHFFTVNGQNTVYYEVGNDMAYIYDTGNQDVRTEGMSYGLMICLQMGDREKFDKIWRWAKKYMQYKKGDQREGLFAWQCETNGNIKGASCAPDGEMYFLTALWFASHRWGNDGAINYEEEAQYLAKMILEKPNRQAGAVSPIFNYTNHIVTFGETSYGFSDPSYNLPGFLELWARWSDTHRDFWVQTPAAARGLLQNSCHSRTGLFPDYCQFDGTPYRPDWAGYNTARYQYDASRSAMNVGMDYNWFASDAQQPAMMERLLKFFQSDNFQHGYFDWDGSNASDGYNQAMHGSNGVAVFALQNNDNLAKTYVQRLWDAQVPTGQWRYYNGMVYFLSMLHASGYFKIYKPCPEVIEENLSGPAPIEFNGEEYSKDTTFKTLIDCKIYDVTITIEASSNYTVTFVDYNDEVLKTEEVAAGESATAPTEPTREGYDFAGWDTDFSNVTSNLTVKATYTEKEKADYTALNAAIAQAEALTEDNYTAATWSALQTALTAANAVDKNLYADDQATVNAATEALTAAIEALAEVTFTVTFVDWDDTPIGDAQIIKKGGAAQAPANPTREGYTFVGWDTEFTNVDSDLTVKATYNKKDAGSKYEAENAQGNGTQTVSNNTASGGKYVRMNEGSLTFTVNVESAGMYTAKFAYSLTEDYKAQFLSVNGSQVGTVGFNKSGSANPTFATVEACVMLNAGSNTIALTKSWGYVDIDYLEISEYERTQFNIDEALVTPNPQPATVEVYEFLKDNFGKKTISGVMTLDLLKNNNILPLASQPEVSYINSKTGKTPALVGFDFMHSTGKNSTNDWQQLYTQAAIAMAEELWNAGGIPTFSWHWRDPNQNGDSFNTSETSFDLTKAFSNSSYTQWNTNSTEYKNMIKDIDIIAGYLEELQCAGVTILWRPIHEASGKWFWWGAKGAEPYKQLYKLLFDRLVNYHQIHNLIWVWNSDGTDADWYPGDEYVDVVGRDFYYDDGSTYNHSSLVTDFEALAKQTNGKKLITLAENGAVPYPENMDNDDAMWSWFMPWYGDYVTSSSHNTASDWNTIMNDSRVITLSDMGGWDNRTKIYDTTTVETLYAKNGFSVTPSKEGDSEHEITVTSSHNCDSVVVLYLHADAAVIVNYTVSFVDYDDSPITSVEVVEGESATAPEDPTREGYDFAGWDTDFSNVTADLTVKATYIIKTFTVSFVDWDNSPIGEAQTVDYGTAAVAPTAPTREHFTFKQWDTDFSNVKANLTVKAVYEENAKAEYTALNNAIAQAEALTEDEYTAESWSALQTALTSAKAVDKSLYAEDQATVDAATSALTSAINALAEQTYTVTFIGKDGQELK
ncbi:MAG: InlB B-repeat-containing protein, partial [Bacteroidales bacterium]|nr:InlB B-repeat-containing protein [Bacteroidales bacterium]